MPRQPMPSSVTVRKRWSALSIQPTSAKTSKDVIGYGGDLPIVASVDDALAYEPRKLLIGIANPGGILPDSWRQSIVTAIESELEVICGLHFFLNDDPEFSRLAKKHGVKLTDLRRPPSPHLFLRGHGRPARRLSS